MGVALQSAYRNTSNVPYSHGQDGYGMGAHGYLGDRTAINSGPGGGKIVQGANWQDPGSLPDNFGGAGQWTMLANGRPIRKRFTDAQQAARKGNSFDLLPYRYLDDPHGNQW